MEIAQCLKDKSQHDIPTAISSGCTDFMALHTACKDELERFCDDAYFTDDTIPCLTQWTDVSQLSDRCASVVKWAVPQEEEEGDAPTDELGMSEQDYQEKLEWQKKRKAARGDSIERLKMKGADKKKEEERVALENLKREDPEGYAQMIEQQKEDQRQQEEFKKRERMLAAAYERKKKVEQGINDTEEEAKTESKPKKKKSGQKKSKPSGDAAAGSWLPALACLTVVGALCGLGLYAVKLMQVAKPKVRKPKKK